MRHRSLFVLLVFLFALSPGAVHAQYQVLNGAFTSGGGVRAGGGYIAYDTTGQPAIGIVWGPSNTVKAGFWHCAGISSTVDVAFASFFGELRDDVVLLSWSASASAPFDGFNIYRSEGTGETLVRINGELIPRAAGNSYRDETVLAGSSYLYRVGAVSKDAEWYSLEVSVAVPSKPTTLYQNYPNPFNPSTNIAFYLASPERVSLLIYDVKGSVVRTLVDAAMATGRHTAIWDGKNDSGRQTASGVYYYRLAAGKTTFTKKLVVMR